MKSCFCLIFALLHLPFTKRLAHCFPTECLFLADRKKLLVYNGRLKLFNGIQVAVAATVDGNEQALISNY